MKLILISAPKVIGKEETGLSCTDSPSVLHRSKEIKKTRIINQSAGQM